MNDSHTRSMFISLIMRMKENTESESDELFAAITLAIRMRDEALSRQILHDPIHGKSRSWIHASYPIYLKHEAFYCKACLTPICRRHDSKNALVGPKIVFQHTDTRIPNATDVFSQVCNVKKCSKKYTFKLPDNWSYSVQTVTCPGCSLVLGVNISSIAWSSTMADDASVSPSISNHIRCRNTNEPEMEPDDGQPAEYPSVIKQTFFWKTPKIVPPSNDFIHMHRSKVKNVSNISYLKMNSTALCARYLTLSDFASVDEGLYCKKCELKICEGNQILSTRIMCSSPSDENRGKKIFVNSICDENINLCDRTRENHRFALAVVCRGCTAVVGQRFLPESDEDDDYLKHRYVIFQSKILYR